MKSLFKYTAIAAILLLVWAYFTGKLSFLKAQAGKATDLVNETASSLSSGSGSGAQVTTNVTTPTPNPVTTGTAVTFNPTKRGKTKRTTIATLNGVKSTLGPDIGILLYGTDGNGNYITNKGLIILADVQITGVLVENNGGIATTGGTSDFNLKVIKSSSFRN